MNVLASITKKPYDDCTKYFFYPQYEILDNNTLRKIQDRRQEFPNKGTSFIMIREGDTNKILQSKIKIIEQYLDSLLPINIDTTKAVETYRSDDENSCMYNIINSSIVGLDSNEIIEIIRINDDIKEIINNDSRRNIHIAKLPLNKKVMLEIGEYIYGYFEYSIPVNAEVGNETDEVGYTIRISASPLNRNTIKRYKKQDIKSKSNSVIIDYDGSSREFLYNLKTFESIQEEEIIDFIEDKPLVNLLRKVAEDSKKIKLTNEQIRKIKECLIDCDTIEFKESKIERLTYKILVTDEYLEFKQALMSEYFNTEAGIQEKKEYLESNQDELEKILNEVKGVQKINEKIDKEIEDRQNEVRKIDILIKEKQEELNNIDIQKNQVIDEKLESERKQFKNIEEKTKKLEEKEKELKAKIQEYTTINDMIEVKKRLDEDKQFLERSKEELRSQVETLRDELNSASANRKKDLFEYVNHNIRKEIFENILKQKQLSSEQENDMRDICLIEERKSYDSAEEIIDLVYDVIVNKGKREFDKKDIINILICISQNFVTIFAGEPGVGKTSLCELIAKSLGLYEQRYAKVAVERGWTSSKDLIGYYNPLTKVIEKTNIEMYRCLKTIDYEVNNDINELFFVLLDEANLSPIEHYWSSFMMLTDKYNRNAIQIGGDIEYKLSEGVRFLATINYDHTTENLSDRFLDRAWVILIDVPQQEALLDTEEFEENISNVPNVINLESLKKYFTLVTCENDKILNQSIERMWLNIIEILYQGKIHISARSRIAVVNYCIVAQKYMDIENNRYSPLDYAVAQKILPMINGYGEQYRETLSKLLEVFKSNSMEKCKDILDRIIEVGDREHGYYQYFCR